MTVQFRNNVHVHGQGPATLIFSHGFGCDQNVWRFLKPAFENRFRIVTYDLVGSGASELAAYDRQKYGSLHGYADDLIEIAGEFGAGPVIHVGHSVSSMTGLLATIKAPQLFAAHVMIAPSPCYINDDDYVGGFERADIDDLLETIEANYLGWSRSMAPVIMGAPDQPELVGELTDTFCRNDPAIASHFARVTFLSDHRRELALSDTPTLLLQCTDDLIAPRQVGEYMQARLQSSVLKVVDNIGHCPHMGAAPGCAAAMDEFFREMRLTGG